MANQVTVKNCVAGVAAAVLLLVLSVPLHSMGKREQKPPEQEKAVPAPSNRPDSRTVIRDILNDPKKFSDFEITLEGAFRGWKGSCPSSAMMTRSDWVLEDQTGCIYVTGLVPHDLSPMQPQGERILVSGRVIEGKTGKPVIKASRVIRIPCK